MAAASGGSAVCEPVGEHGAGGVVEHRREAIALDPLEGVGERVDRIVGARARAVAARVGRGQGEALVDLLGGLHREAQSGAVGEEGAAAAVGVEGEVDRRRIEPLVGGEVGAVAGGLLVAGEQDDDVAVGLEAFGAQAQQSGGDRGHALLVVDRAAAVEIAVLLAEREGIAGPVLAARLDHVHVRHQQDRLAPGGARRRPADGKRGGLVMGADLDVGEARLAIDVRRDIRRAAGSRCGPGRSGRMMARA